MSDKKKIPPRWTKAIFEDLLDYTQPTNYIVESTEYADSYKIPVLTAGKSFIIGYTNEINGIYNEIPVIIFDDFTTSTQFVNFPFKVKSSAMKILKPTNKLVNIRFVFYYMQTLRINADTHKRYWISQYSQLPIPLPPHPEQQRIVAKIEELFSSLDKGIENLKTAQQQLKVYRQAVLKWAFEGKLTNKNVVEGKLPTGWMWMKLGDTSEMCLGKMLDKAKNKGDLQPYLRNISVRWGTFDLSGLEKMKFEEFENERYSLKKGDLVICEGGEPGRCAIWISNESMYIQKALHRVRMHNGYDTSYTFYFIFYSALNGDLEKYFTGTTIKHLTGNELKKVVFPTPPTLKEQQTIVAEIESRLSVCDKIKESIEQSLNQSESLRQSILKKAFEGMLVPQDPNDEPASVLLERIRQKRFQTSSLTTKTRSRI